MPFEGSFRGNLILANPSSDACSSISSITTSGPNSVFNPIILANWGGCHYSNKIRNAELAGARMLILILNPTESLDSTPVQLAIQSHLEILTIKYQDGMGLISALEEAQEKPAGDPESVIQVFYSYDPKKVSETVKSDAAYLSYWFVTNDASKRSYDLLNDLQGVLLNFGSALNFSPHYVIWEDMKVVRNNEFSKSTRCISGGRYCDATGDNLFGNEAVMETLRQICLRDSGEDHTNIDTYWWKYITHFANECVGTGERDCHKKAFQMANIPEETIKMVNACMRGSFGATVDENLLETFKDNSELLDEVRQLKHVDVYDFPSLYVNGWRYTGSLRNMTTLTEFICENFYSEKAPPVCTGHVPFTLKDYSVYGAVLLGSAMIMAFVLYFVRRSVRREMMMKVNNDIPRIVTQYQEFKDKSDLTIADDNENDALENAQI